MKMPITIISPYVPICIARAAGGHVVAEARDRAGPASSLHQSLPPSTGSPRPHLVQDVIGAIRDVQGEDHTVGQNDESHRVLKVHGLQQPETGAPQGMIRVEHVERPAAQGDLGKGKSSRVWLRAEESGMRMRRACHAVCIEC